VAVATQELTLVNLTSPIAGTIGAVSITVGQQVSASSTSAVITVLGTDGYVVDLTVPLTSLEKVVVGQSATALVPTTSTALTGRVSSIGVRNVSSTSTPEYDLVVALDATKDPLFDGSSAQVAIAVAATGQVITVPTSAVHVSGQGATVQVLAGGQVSEVTVQRGAVGAELTEITSGLTVGQVVVLADRSQHLPSSSTNQSSGLAGLTNRSTTRVGVGGGLAPGGGTFRGNG
jgi:multidrug efflux pump subunit AcrA (membrane-fusion protein)